LNLLFDMIEAAVACHVRAAKEIIRPPSGSSDSQRPAGSRTGFIDRMAREHGNRQLKLLRR
jgi:hypothetical protein